MIDSVIASNGRTKLPEVVRKASGVTVGDRICQVMLDHNEVRIIPVCPVSRLLVVHRRAGASATLEDMEQAIADGVSANRAPAG